MILGGSIKYTQEGQGREDTTRLTPRDPLASRRLSAQIQRNFFEGVGHGVRHESAVAPTIPETGQLTAPTESVAALGQVGVGPVETQALAEITPHPSIQAEVAGYLAIVESIAS